MDSTGILLTLGVLFCLGLLALVSAASESLESFRSAEGRGEGGERLQRMQRQGSWAAGHVLGHLDHRGRVWATVSIVRTGALVAVAALSVALALRGAPGLPGVALLALLVGAALALAVQAWGHAVAASAPERTALFLAPAVSALLWGFRPLAWGVLAASRALARRKGGQKPAEKAAPEDIAARERKAYEQRMIRAILRLAATSVREIMVPRMDILAISARASVRQAVDLIIAEGYSRIPVYGRSLDNIVGVLHTKDLLPHVGGQTAPVELRQIARRPYFVPETKRVDELLREMQDKRVQLAIVVDEYGGTAGVVSIEDVVEEIVGDIEDEFDVAEQRVVRVSEAEAIMDGRVSVNEIGRLFGVEVQAEGFDTVGGYVYHLLGKVPSVGDRVVTDQLRLDVLSTLGRRVSRVRVTRALPEARVPPP